MGLLVPTQQLVPASALTQIVTPLPGGNVLFSNHQTRVAEVTRDKKIVWEYRVRFPADAFRLPSGNTLITSNTRFIEVTPDKKIVWTKPGCNYGSARR